MGNNIPGAGFGGGQEQDPLTGIPAGRKYDSWEEIA